MALSYFQTTWNSAGTNSGSGCYKDITFTGVAVGDLLIVGASAEANNYSGGVRSVVTQPPGTTSAWTLVQPSVATGSDVDVVGGYATASSSGTITVRVQVRPSAVDYMGVGGVLIPAAEWTGTPVVATGIGLSNGLISLAVPATSTVIAVGADWNAVTVSGATPAGNTIRQNTLVSGRYTPYIATWTAQASGTRNYGPSSTGLDYSGFVIAVREAAGTTNYNGGSTSSGSGSTSTSGVLGKVATSALAGVVAISAAGFVGTSLDGMTLSGAATSTSAGYVGRVQDALLPGTAAITASGSVGVSHTGMSSLPGVGDILAAGVVARIAASNVVGSGGLTASGEMSLSSESSLTGLAAITTTGAVVSGASGTADLFGSGVVSSGGRVDPTSTAVVTGNAAVVVSGVVARGADSDLASVGFLVAAGEVGGRPEPVVQPEIIVDPAEPALVRMFGKWNGVHWSDLIDSD